MPSPAPQRIIALGASNLTRGFRAIAAASRSRWGASEILAALGHGRSYGAASTVFGRTLPGILESGLWRELDRLPPAPARALITDVGNDIVYGYSPNQILSWIDESIIRLQRHTDDIVITGLPLASIRALSPKHFLLMRSLLFPRSEITHEESVESGEAVAAGLRRLAADRNVRFFPLKECWYGYDPIHIRPCFWSEAWQEILCGDAAEKLQPARLEALRLYFLRPERQTRFGIERITPQPVLVSPKLGRIWLY